MYVVVAGAGEVGRNLARAFRTEGHDVVVLDRDPEALAAVRRLDVLTVTGGAGSPATQKAAGVEKADVFIAVTDHDEANLVACAVAKARNKDCRTIARVNGLDYMREPVSEEYKAIGCDVAVCPELVAARRIARILDVPGMVDATVFAAGKVQVVEARVAPNAKLAGLRLDQAAIPAGCRLVALYHEDIVTVPGGSDVLRADDRVVAVARDAASVRVLATLLGAPGRPLSRGPVDKIMVVGASRVGIHLCRILQGKKEVTLVERDRQRAQEVTDQLAGILVIHGDAADRETLKEEGIDEVDALVACEDRDEFNVMTCLLAKQLGVPRVMSLVAQGSVKSIAERIGIDLAVSPRQASLGAFLRAAHGQATQLHLLGQGDAQVLEFKVDARSKMVGTKLRKAGFPRGSAVGAIARGSEVLVPGGEEFILAGDTLVVFALAEVAPKVHRMF